jgi:hypothetical protein
MRAQGKEKEKGLPAWVGCGPKVKGEREGVRVFLFFSFKFSFQIHFFQTFKLQSNKIHALES